MRVTFKILTFIPVVIFATPPLCVMANEHSYGVMLNRKGEVLRSVEVIDVDDEGDGSDEEKIKGMLSHLKTQASSDKNGKTSSVVLERKNDFTSEGITYARYGFSSDDDIDELFTSLKGELLYDGKKGRVEAGYACVLRMSFSDAVLSKYRGANACTTELAFARMQ